MQRPYLIDEYLFVCHKKINDFSSWIKANETKAVQRSGLKNTASLYMKSILMKGDKQIKNK